MKHEKNSKPPKCPIFSLILNFKIRPMGLKKKHEKFTPKYLKNAGPNFKT
jgi:hypothetical protein